MNDVAIYIEADAQLLRVCKEHGPLGNNMAALGAVTEEYHELIHAIRKDKNVRGELLDIAVVCLRRIMEIDEETRA